MNLLSIILHIHIRSETTSDNYSFLFEIIKWVTPVVLFFAAYFINEQIKKRHRKKQLKKLFDYFLTILKALVKQTNKQIEQNIDCINRIKDPDEDYVAITKVAGNNIKRLNEIKFDDLFEIFLNKDKKSKSKKKSSNIDLFHKLNADIDYLETVIPTLFTENMQTTSKLSSYQNNWNSFMLKIVELRNNIAQFNAMNRGQSGIPDPFAIGFIRIYDTYTQQGGSEINKLNKMHVDLIMPLINHAKLYNSDTRSKMLLQYCIPLNVIYEDSVHIRRQHRSFLIHITRSIMKSSRELKYFLEKQYKRD